MRKLPVLDSRELSEINAFLDGLKDPIYKKRLAELEATKKEANALIAVVGKVNEIDKFHLKASQLEEGAGKLAIEAKIDRDAAKVDAADIRKEAGKKAAAKLDDANTQFAEREMAVVSAENELKQDQEELAKDLDAFDSVITQTNKKLIEANATKNKYITAVNDLREATNRIAGNL